MALLKGKKEEMMGNVLGSLGQSKRGLTCEEYTLLIVAGPPNKPEEIIQRMKDHEESCSYHRSRGFRQSALGIPISEDLEKEAVKIIHKYS